MRAVQKPEKAGKDGEGGKGGKEIQPRASVALLISRRVDLGSTSSGMKP